MAASKLPPMPPPKAYDSWDDSDEDQIIFNQRQEKLAKQAKCLGEISSASSPIVSSSIGATERSISSFDTSLDISFDGTTSSSPLHDPKLNKPMMEEDRSLDEHVFPDMQHSNFFPDSIQTVVYPKCEKFESHDHHVFRVAFWNAQYYTELWYFRFDTKPGAPKAAVEAILVQSIIEKMIFQKERKAPWKIIPHEEQNAAILPLLKKYDIAVRRPLLLKWATSLSFHNSIKKSSEGKSSKNKSLKSIVKKMGKR